MIEAAHISKCFGRQTVLSDISFQLPAGEIYGLIGYNGVGKTTLLKILSGIYRPDAGCATIDGIPVYEHPEIKKRCFFMTEEAAFFSQSSLLQMRRFYRGYYPDWQDKTFEGLIAWFGVNPAKKIGQFSKGMQRQASLALAFATHAKYLFMDEAFDGLDFTIRRQLREMLLYYTREKQAAIVISSHNLRELEGLADHIGMLSEGTLIFNGSTRHMREQYHACRFRFDGPVQTLSSLEAELLERENDGYFCILHADREQALERLHSVGAESASVRSVELEEFFRKERDEKEVDWKEIFG